MSKPKLIRVLLVGCPTWFGLGAPSVADNDTTATVVFRTCRVPSKPIPPEVRAIALAPVEVKKSFSNALDWNEMLRRQLMSKLGKYRDANAPSLSIYNRDDMKYGEDERERHRAGALRGEDDTDQMRQSLAEIMIVAEVECSVEKAAGWKEQPDIDARALGSISNWSWRSFAVGRTRVQRRTVREVSVHVVVACRLSVLLPLKGFEPWSVYSETLRSSDKTKTSIFMGIGGKSEAELMPVQSEIQSLLDRHLDAFLSDLVPMGIEERVTISTDIDALRPAVAALSSGRWRQAGETAARVARIERDKPGPYFVMAVSCEKQGRLDWARDHYLNASRHGKDPQYQAGLARVQRLGRPVELPGTMPQVQGRSDIPDSATRHESTPAVGDLTGGASPNIDSKPCVELTVRIDANLAAALNNAVRANGGGSAAEGLDRIVSESLWRWLAEHGHTSQETSRPS